MKPLLDVGVAVRLRYLEQTRQTLMEGEIFDIDTRIIKEGNIAAHSANADVDLALARAGHIENKYSEVQMMGETFEKLYQLFPENHQGWKDWPRTIRRTIECQAIVLTVKNVRDGYATPTQR
jgi:hypothetical protein